MKESAIEKHISAVVEGARAAALTGVLEGIRLNPRS
jgi:hypothetical protein